LPPILIRRICDDTNEQVSRTDARACAANDVGGGSEHAGTVRYFPRTVDDVEPVHPETVLDPLKAELEANIPFLVLANKGKHRNWMWEQGWSGIDLPYRLPKRIELMPPELLNSR
jgi:hypothetical protein